MQDAVFKVKADLGANAVILHTRKIREGGFFGLFGKKMIEVIATVEDDRESQLTKELRQELNVLREKVQKLDKEKQETQQQKQQLENQQAQAQQPNLQYQHVQAQQQQLPQQNIQPNQQFSQQAPLTQTLLQRFSGGGSYQSVAQPVSQLLFPGYVQKYAEKLSTEGVSLEMINEVCQGAMNSLEVHELHKEECVYNALVDQITRRIVTYPAIEIAQTRKVMAFVGPTGVGKTTTIAKLAARIALQQRTKKVGLITADTYRIAAVEQLKTYSDIINVPLRVIYTGAELEQALKDLDYCDLIFIDTAGRSQKSESQMEQLKDILPKQLIDEIHLVLAMNTRYDDMLEIINKFNEPYLSSLVFTKRDETSKKGVLLNVLKETGYKVSYITFGQDVPEDIEEANPRKIAEMILKE